MVKLELTDEEYDAIRALLYQTTTSAYAKAVGCTVFMAAHLEMFPKTFDTLKVINKKLLHISYMVLQQSD